jgi:selenocysteine lyase/cysteine desulfurase
MRVQTVPDDLLRNYPEYAATGRVDAVRRSDYSYGDTGQVYLDYAGAGLPARHQINAHAARLTANRYGNPHSANPTSVASTELVSAARRAVLAFVNASPEEYAVIFTPNATGACRLVAEAYPFAPGVRLVLASDNHNSVNGIREFARSRGAQLRYVPVSGPQLRIPDADLAVALGRRRVNQFGRPSARRGLFAYAAQSNFTGVQHPLDWVDLAHERGYDVLLDAAAFVPTNRLDLTEVQPDFVAISWYKVFGYPTGVGCLIARRDALARLHRPWFAGGTIRAVSVLGDWHQLLDDESGYEDGTVNFLAIPDVQIGLDWVHDIGIDLIHRRVRCLTGWTLDRLTALRHSNGRPVVRVYGPLDTHRRGATVALNFLDPHGVLVDERLVAQESAAAGISLRTGCFCNPGAGEGAFAIAQRDLRQVPYQRLGSIDEYLRVLALPTGGAVRISFGLASNASDAASFLAFAEATYTDRPAPSPPQAPRLTC